LRQESNALSGRCQQGGKYTDSHLSGGCETKGKPPNVLSFSGHGEEFVLLTQKCHSKSGTFLLLSRAKGGTMGLKRNYYLDHSQNEVTGSTIMEHNSCCSGGLVKAQPASLCAGLYNMIPAVVLILVS
jgi:hypothetical protein